MPMLLNTKEEAEKEAYKFGCEGAYQMGEKWMSCSMYKQNHLKKEGFIIRTFDCSFKYFEETVEQWEKSQGD